MNDCMEVNDGRRYPYCIMCIASKSCWRSEVKDEEYKFEKDLINIHFGNT